MSATLVKVCEVCGDDTEFGNSLCEHCAYELNGRLAIECELCGSVKERADAQVCSRCSYEMAEDVKVLAAENLLH